MLIHPLNPPRNVRHEAFFHHLQVGLCKIGDALYAADKENASHRDAIGTLKASHKASTAADVSDKLHSGAQRDENAMDLSVQRRSCDDGDYKGHSSMTSAVKIPASTNTNADGIPEETCSPPLVGIDPVTGGGEGLGSGRLIGEHPLSPPRECPFVSIATRGTPGDVGGEKGAPSPLSPSMEVETSRSNCFSTDKKIKREKRFSPDEDAHRGGVKGPDSPAVDEQNSPIGCNDHGKRGRNVDRDVVQGENKGGGMDGMSTGGGKDRGNDSDNGKSPEWKRDDDMPAGETKESGQPLEEEWRKEQDFEDEDERRARKVRVVQSLAIYRSQIAAERRKKEVRGRHGKNGVCRGEKKWNGVEAALYTHTHLPSRL